MADSAMGVGGGGGSGGVVSGTVEVPPAWAERVEIDTSAPFESVREAIDRFGGSALWKDQLRPLFTHSLEKHHFLEEADVMCVEEETEQLEKDLLTKERETLDILEELEMTKRVVDGLKMKLQKEASKGSETKKVSDPISSTTQVHPSIEKEENFLCGLDYPIDGSPSSAANLSPDVILKELKQAKLNLHRTTSDLAGIRVCIDQLNKKIAGEKILLEKTREKLSTNTAKMSSLEEELTRTTMKLQEIKNTEATCSADPADISRQINELSSEMEKYKSTAEIAKSEILELTSNIQQSKASIEAAEIRCVAVKKMEEAARASEAVALAEVKSVIDSKGSILDVEGHTAIILPIEEYVTLTRKAEDAAEMSRKKVESAMTDVDDANREKAELLVKVEEAMAEVKTSRKALEEALERVEVAKDAKRSVEQALRKCRSEHPQKHRCIQSSTKFKNTSQPTRHRRDCCITDFSGMSVLTEKPPSIGQILSMKLMTPEKYEIELQEKINQNPNISLGQMLTKKNGVVHHGEGCGSKQSSAKRKKFGLVNLSVILARQEKNRKKKRQSLE